MASTEKSPVLGFDEKFGQRLAGEPGYRPPVDGLPWLVDGHGAGAGSKDLKSFIAEQTEQTPGPSTIVYVLDEPFAVFFDKDIWRATGKLAGFKHALSGKSREEVLGKLVRLGQRVHGPRELNETELTEVARAAQRDRVQAIDLYLSYAFPKAEESDAEKIVNDPRLAPFLAQICEFVWLNSRLDATDSMEWQNFKAQFIAGRPVSCALLDHAWEEFCDQRNRRLLPPGALEEKEEVLDPTQIVESLEGMSDEEVRQQYWNVAKAHARAAR